MKTTTTAAALTLLALPATAATFDFAAVAHDAYAEHGQEVSFATHLPNGYTVDGITVNASTNGQTVWLDSRTVGGKRNAGLGSCELADCNAHWLDGIDADDILTLTFGQEVRLTGLSIRESSFAYVDGTAPDHTPFSGMFMVDGQSFRVVDGITQGLDLNGREFALSADDLFAPAGGEVSQYVAAVTVAPVPLPAAGLLLIAGLGALVWRARK